MAFPILTTIEVIVSILLLRLRGLRLALKVLTSNICLFFLSSSISSIRTVSAVAILDLKAMICWMKNIFAVLLRCYVYILYHSLSTSF